MYTLIQMTNTGQTTCQYTKEFPLEDLRDVVCAPLARIPFWTTENTGQTLGRSLGSLAGQDGGAVV